MATPPYTLDETSPGDSDLVSQFPSEQRDNLDIIEDWINTEHSTYGHHKIPSGSEATRDATTSWVAGSLFYNTDTGNLQICTSADPDVWASVFEGTLEAPSGTEMLFHQTAAPAGWTKDTTYNNFGVRITSGTASGGGTEAFTSVFTSRTITQANLPSYNLSHSLSAASHTHTFSDSSSTTSTNGSHNHSFSDTSSVSPDYYYANLGSSSSESDDAWFNRANTDAGTGATRVTGWDSTFRSDRIDVSVSGTTSSSGSHSHTVAVSGTTGESGSLSVSGTVSSGGSGTPLNFNLVYRDVILAIKD